jgi:hypothetical protein
MEKDHAFSLAKDEFFCTTILEKTGGSIMKCGICGIEVGSIDEAIDEGWIPYVWDGDHEKEGPYCGSCAETLLRIDENGEFVVKEEYRGKITFKEGDFVDEDPERQVSIGIVLEYCEN